jgi:hypothetical protein
VRWTGSLAGRRSSLASTPSSATCTGSRLR